MLHGIIVGFSGKFQFPVFRSRPEVENMTMHSFRVNSIHPQSFIQIGILVSEILGNTPKMNAILPGVPTGNEQPEVENPIVPRLSAAVTESNT